MMKKWHVYFVSVMWTCFAATGCQAPLEEQSIKQEMNMTDRLQYVDRVSILTTSGQEIQIDPMRFHQLVLEGNYRKLSPTPEKLSEEEIFYRLIAYVPQEAPVVMEVGPTGFTYANQTFRGSDAEEFYQQTKVQLGNALLPDNPPMSLEMKANDLPGRPFANLQGNKLDEAWDTLSQITYTNDEFRGLYPLYPSYQISFRHRDGQIQFQVLNPGLLKCILGKETLYYQASDELYPFIEDLLPVKMDSNKWQALYEADELKVVQVVNKSEEKDSILKADNQKDKSSMHQVVRLLQGSYSQTEVTEQGPSYLRLLIIEQENVHEVKVWKDYFEWNGQIFRHVKLQEKLEVLLFS
ncbi:hypothetical protein [Brevibacillus daliensis]|uniref:hypothetical protein n=1 Tax=Brevibacillus daliensis TaxID=2892995 RepID=UPI001E494F09|nr:hypothetical protein [Brevibacillus daliensis]